jgi:hypothetical protein
MVRDARFPRRRPALLRPHLVVDSRRRGRRGCWVGNRQSRTSADPDVGKRQRQCGHRRGQAAGGCAGRGRRHHGGDRLRVISTSRQRPGHVSAGALTLTRQFSAVRASCHARQRARARRNRGRRWVGWSLKPAPTPPDTPPLAWAPCFPNPKACTRPVRGSMAHPGHTGGPPSGGWFSTRRIPS